jgi:5,10-methylenetetrahydromethanopterin reductase
MDGRVRTPIDADSEGVLTQVHGAYDMTMHTRSGSAQAGTLSGDFTDRFAVIGSAEHCIERLRSLIALGVDRLVVVGPSIDADATEGKQARHAMVAEVLPALRQIYP